MPEINVDRYPYSLNEMVRVWLFSPGASINSKVVGGSGINIRLRGAVTIKLAIEAFLIKSPSRRLSIK